MMRSGAVALALTLALTATAQAKSRDSTAETYALAEQLVELTSSAETQKALLDKSWPPLEAEIRKAAPDISDKDAAELEAEYKDLLRSEIRKIMVDVPRLYAKYFSTKDLRAMLAFYRSAIGKKRLATMPKISAELIETTFSRIPDSIAKVNQSFDDKLRAKGIILP